MGVLVARLADLTGEREHLAGVVAAPAVMGGRSTRDEHDAESDDECDARLHDESLLPCLVQPDD